MRRKLALFADGTGNAFTTQESNIWRLYQALDQSQPDQLARYIPGVGTSGFRPLAMLDGATGIGVPSNVRKLYRFLCWNWQPGDEIYLFGFSRGAFTIRTLVGLINSEGLVPATMDGEFVSRADMERNAMGAWRAYREKTAGGIVVGVSPLVWLTRKVRNALLWTYDRVRGHTAYSEIRKETERQNRRWRAGDDSSVSITFLGLFDTVEAYGVPIEELRSAIDWAIWPISFRNHRLSGIVKRAFHALALDDERISFHPLRFDMTQETGEEGNQRITEVWFAGVHSDVGGGYPESALAHVPLHWMASAAGHAASDPAGQPTGQPTGQGLRFTRGEFEGFKADASPLEPMHDSRAGSAVFYRYGPRPIRDDVASGGAPVIHHSVAEKMVFGSESYAPITLPPTAYVLMPDGVKHTIKGFGGRGSVAAAEAGEAGKIGELPAAERAVARLSEPSQAFVELTRDTVWWRRIAYMALLVAFICAAALPVTAGWLTAAAKWVVVGVCGDACWQSLADANSGVGGNLDSIAKVIGGFLPDYAAAWIAAFIRYPFACLAVVIGTYLLYRVNNRLRDRIADRARCAWFAPRPAAGKPLPNAAPGLWLKLARYLRRSPKAFAVYAAVTRYVVPAFLVVVLLLAIPLGVLLSISRSTITYREAQGTLCVPDEAKVRKESDLDNVPPDGSPLKGRQFDIASPCWGSGIKVEKGFAYRIEIDAEGQPFLDRTIMADIYGFSLASHTLALPIRRWWSAEWLQPIAKIGAKGLAEWPLAPADGGRPIELGGQGRPVRYEEACLAAFPDDAGACPQPEPGSWEPLRGKALAAAQRIHREQRHLRRVFVSEFVAQETGELYLYVNDAIVGIPLLPKRGQGFYANNAGIGEVSVARVRR